MKIAKIVAVIYVLLCVLSLAVIPASAFGWFGLDEDPLAGVFAIFLALPWSAFFGSLGEGRTFVYVLVLMAGMLANVAIILGLGMIFRRKRQPGGN